MSRALAERYWPAADAIGKRLAFGVNGTNWQTVIGVADDIRDRQLQEVPREVVYAPYASVGWQFMTLLIRGSDDVAALAPVVRRTIWSIDPALPVPDVRPLADYRADAVAGSRFNMLLMTVFAAVALLLGMLGVYGVTLFAVARRTREFGVRLALGAARGSVLRMVLREAARPVLLGIAFGLAGAALLSRLVTALLFGTEPVEPAIYAAAALALAAVALGSSLLPAWRATRVDPRVALAAE